MKKHLLKLTLLVAVLFSASTMLGQALWTTNGTYKIATSGLSPNLYMTINGNTGALEWAEELPNDDPTQVWNVIDHREPAAPGYMEIWATIPGVGDFTMVVDRSTIATLEGGVTDGDDKDFTITVRPGLPIGDTADENYGFDQFQRRKAKVNAEGLADATGANPAAGNNALFIKPAGGASGASRYGAVPAAAGDPVLFDGGGIDVLQYFLIEEAVASTKNFDASSLSISNPVNDNLVIKGINSDITSVSVYNLLGSKVLTSSIAGKSSVELSVSNLVSGMYIVKLEGANGAFSKKIIKQ
jgi:hypothetical protein